MKLRLPLRWRLNLFSAGLLAGIYLLLAILLYSSVDRLLLDNAGSYARQLARADLVHPEPPPRGGRGGKGQPDDAQLDSRRADEIVRALAGPGSSVVVWTRAGEVITSSSALDANPMRPPTQSELAQAANLPADGVYQYVSGSQRTLSQLLPIEATNGRGVLQINTSLAPADTLLGQLRLLLAAGLLVAVLCALLFGLPLVRAALRPLDRVAAAADRLATGDLKSRVAESGQHDEIGRLAGSFNHMAGELEQSFDRQRRFVADASHELKTPLTALEGEVEMMLLGADGGNPATRQRLLLSMEREIGRMARLVSDLLTLSRSDDPRSYPLRQQQCDLRPLVGEVGEQLAHAASQHTVACDLPTQPVVVSGDPDRLRQVLLNLGDNARKFTPAGGHIRLSLCVAEQQAVVSVCDDGPGIAAADQPHIFERFYRADSARTRGAGGGGAGLGLAIAQAIVLAHRGTISIASNPSQGATFTVRLPLA